jgi:hypothetical protein
MDGRRPQLHRVVTATECRKWRVWHEIGGLQRSFTVPHLHVNVRITLFGRVPCLADMANQTRGVDIVALLHEVLGLQMAIETPGMIGVFDDDHESESLVMIVRALPSHINHFSRRDGMHVGPQRSRHVRSLMKPATIPRRTKVSIALIHFRF